MKRLHYALATAILLAACSTNHTARYALSFNVQSPADQQALTQMSMRVIERRVEHLGDKVLDKSVETKGSGTVLTVTLEQGKVINDLTKELTRPFDLQIMAQTASGETADITIEGRGSFKKAGITQADLVWVDARKDPTNGKGEVRLDFTPAGKTKMSALFKQSIGHDIGLFVHGRLISQLHVKTDSLPDNLIIRDVPTAELAQVFAEDMDVGLHVIFTPLH